MALKGFHKQTKDLSDYEKNNLLPAVIRGLKTKIGESNQITNKQAVKGLRTFGYKVSEVRFRALISYIRRNNLIHLLVANNRGYWIATSAKEVQAHIDSMTSRIVGETATRDALKYQLEINKNKL